MNVGAAFELFPLGFALSTADMEATYFLEKDEGEPVFYVPQVFVIVNGQVIDGHVGAVDSYDPSTQTK